MKGTEADRILREFMADVEAVGVAQTGKEWPDLLVTYNKARIYFKARIYVQRARAGRSVITPVKGGFTITHKPCAVCGEPPFGDEYCCGHSQRG